jgi:hypothetical protein
LLCDSVAKRFLEPSCGDAQEAAVSGGLNRHAQQVMCAIVQGDKAERLKYTSLPFADWVQHLRHAFHAARLGLKGDLDEIADGEGPRELQKPAVHRNNVNISLGPLAVSELNDYWCGC